MNKKTACRTIRKHSLLFIMKTLTNLHPPFWAGIAGLAVALLGGMPALAQDLDRQTQVWAASCAACHGTGGHAQTGIPPLAGQPREVLLQKLLAYKAGSLPATVMHQHAKGYTDAELARLADFFSKQTR